MTRQASHRPTGNRERLQRRAAQPDADNINLSSNRNPPIQKERLRSFRSGVELFLRRGSAASTDTPFNDPVDNTRSQNFPTPQASSSSVEPRHSSTSAIVYSSSLGSILVDWVYEQFSRGVYSSDETQALENVLVELKNTKPKLIFVRTEDGMSRWNTLKGNAERIIGGMLDWWPFQPYITPLAKEQACGDTRWAAVPQSFGIKIEDVFENNAAQANQENVSGNDVSHSGARTKIQTAKLVSESALPRPAVNHQNPANPRNIDYQLHAFLILLNSSIFGSVHCLAQTAVHNMSDHEFFTWIRNSYYSQRGFLAIWFGLFRFSHCEFFRVRLFGDILHRR
ncbi:hypothetical protein N7463_007621 [Penicillium fimorum]|uniref:Uncharacterized protein n=1 Tax=Penicillium fimorum TaxID=1882269 RepID=A0A9W9XWT8_9EURO|nr:hypothetical protein N7463_007621 [Penicillium fimorum]